MLCLLLLLVFLNFPPFFPFTSARLLIKVSIKCSEVKHFLKILRRILGIDWKFLIGRICFRKRFESISTMEDNVRRVQSWTMTRLFTSTVREWGNCQVKVVYPCVIDVISSAPWRVTNAQINQYCCTIFLTRKQDRTSKTYIYRFPILTSVRRRLAVADDFGEARAVRVEVYNLCSRRSSVAHQPRSAGSWFGLEFRGNLS